VGRLPAAGWARTTTLSQREIAGHLCVSMNTVKSHTRSVFRKLGVSTRADAVSKGRALGLI
jgi:LuxR family maltose regulon positive regulatory protein